ncbi:MAG: helix-turn-helix domain-containing protein [Treponema sp.]|jgi:transcriptional regulator with XRE-family HTH domain|nr:helix-turn-helix domain-containing protein [Treponema sp.]
MDLDRLFIHNLKKWRKIMGISQKELAEKCDAAHSYIRQIECANRYPSFAFIGKIADALHIEPYQLFYNEAAKPGRSAYTRSVESVQKKLLETVSSDIQAAFDELKKYQ